MKIPTDKPASGVCRVCGCTEARGCIDEQGESCEWADATRTICTRCVGSVAHAMVHATEIISILAELAEEGVIEGNNGGLSASCLKHGVLEGRDVHQFPASQSFRCAADFLEEIAARALVTARIVRAAEVQAKANEDALEKEAA